jgi:asparagine synthetase B (glutamine-hydrolysing)
VIERFVRLGRVGVFLSGGLDSISVAAQAAALSQEAGIEAPVALSMDRRVHDNDETQTQSAIAAALGLPHYLISVDELADDGSLFASGRQMTGRFSYPVANPFLALFYRLVQQPTAQSCKVLMTGGGGDEWLGVSPQLAADHWRHGNLQGLWHMWQVCRQSSDQSWNSLLKSMVWTAGWRPILRDMTLRSWWAISPQTIRRRQIRRMEDGLRIWDFADASLRHTVHERMTRVVQPPPSFEGFYIGAINEVHTHLSVSIDMEQYFELGALCGCPLVLPFWDAELIEMLVRVPPERLNRGNRSKALVRTLVDQLFPSLQLGDQKKAIMRDTLSSIMWRELPALWQAIGSPERLFALDLITPAGATLLYEQSIKSGDLRLLMTVWEIINMESWLRNAET